MTDYTHEALIAAQGQHASDLYTDMFDILNKPQVAIIPNAYGNTSSPQEIPALIWFNQALDAYVLEGAVLETVLVEVQSKIEGYVLCTAAVPTLIA